MISLDAGVGLCMSYMASKGYSISDSFVCLAATSLVDSWRRCGNVSTPKKSGAAFSRTGIMCWGIDGVSLQLSNEDRVFNASRSSAQHTSIWLRHFACTVFFLIFWMNKWSERYKYIYINLKRGFISSSILRDHGPCLLEEWSVQYFNLCPIITSKKPKHVFLIQSQSQLFVIHDLHYTIIFHSILIYNIILIQSHFYIMVFHSRFSTETRSQGYVCPDQLVGCPP